jgi:hypothetical protein
MECNSNTCASKARFSSCTDLNSDCIQHDTETEAVPIDMQSRMNCFSALETIDSKVRDAYLLNLFV